ncbi:MAG: PEGA domain-containing protein [bacterium]
MAELAGFWLNMEYPGTKFTKPFRIVFQLSFVCLFFIISPLIIMYSMGFRYDFSNGIWRETGSLSVDVNPKDGDIYLNGVKLKKNRLNKKVELKNIKPGKYDLLIETFGYHPWLKQIEIENRQTVYIKEINLTRSEQAKILLDKAISGFELMPDKNLLIYSMANGTSTDFYYLDLTTNELKIFYSKKGVTGNIEYEIGNNSCVSIHFDSQPNYNDLDIACADNALAIQLSDFATNTISKIQWFQLNRLDQLAYQTGEKIYTFNPKDKKNTLVATGSIKYIDWYMDDATLWTAKIDTSTNDMVIVKDALKGANEFKRIKLENPQYQRSLSDLIFLKVKNDNILMKNKKTSDLVIINKNGEYFLSGQNHSVSQYNDWWIIWSPWELWTYIEDEKPELQLRSGEKLVQAIPMDEYNALALIWQDKTTVFYPYYLETHTLIDLKIIKSAVDSKKRMMYFTHSDAQGLWALNY